MADIHITRDLLWAVTRGELPANVLTQVGMQHLMSLCGTCRKEINAFQKERTRTADASADYSSAFELLPALLDEEVPRLEREHAGAQRDFEDLLAMPPAAALRTVERARKRFRSPALVRLLIAESRKRVHADPDVAFHVAQLGQLVTHRCPGMPGSFELNALSSAHMANALRASGKLREAEQFFEHCRYLVTHHGVTDTEILARLDHLEGSLRMDQRRFRQAEEILSRAAMLYHITRNAVEVTRVLITLGLMHFYKGDHSAAIETTEAALQGLQGSAYEARLYLCARYNLARFLTEDGQYAEAANLLSEDADLYREFPEGWTQLRLVWLRGKIDAGQGRGDEAERAFLEARDGFMAAGIGYDAAMVCVEDLALLYLREGRLSDVKRLAEEIFPVFESQDVHREALAALRLFQEAARQEQLTVKAVRELVKYLKEARTDPSRRFEQQSS